MVQTHLELPKNLVGSWANHKPHRFTPKPPESMKNKIFNFFDLYMAVYGGLQTGRVVFRKTVETFLEKSYQKKYRIHCLHVLCVLVALKGCMKLPKNHIFAFWASEK